MSALVGSTCSRRSRDERGASLVEAPFAVALVLAIGLGAFWIGNIVVRYHQLDKAIEAGARYGARAEFAPGDGANRRRSGEQVVNQIVQAAAPVVVDPTAVTVECSASTEGPWSACNPNDATVARPGTYLKVRASAVVADDDPVMALARSVNGALSILGAGDALPETVTLTDASVALIE